MHAVIFEVEPQPERRQDYLDIAARLRPELERIDGFISVERFQSLTQEGKILSLSFWRDEEAVARWRSHAQHRTAQRAGRTGVFKNYRLRVAAVMRDYGLEDRNHFFTSTLTLSYSVPRNGPCFTLMHCMSSITRIA